MFLTSTKSTNIQCCKIRVIQALLNMLQIRHQSNWNDKSVYDSSRITKFSPSSAFLTFYSKSQLQYKSCGIFKKILTKPRHTSNIKRFHVGYLTGISQFWKDLFLLYKRYILAAMQFLEIYTISWKVSRESQKWNCKDFCLHLRFREMAGAVVQFEKSDESIMLIRVGSFYFNDFKSLDRRFF